MSKDLLIQVENGVATLTLNRPDSLNALSAEMNQMAQEALSDFATNPKVGCIVVTGAGRGFCSGGDVSAMSGGGSGELPTLEQQIDKQRAGQELSRLLYSIPKVTIAAVNGAAAGAGLGIALACDLRYASSSAKFITAFSRVGFGGDYGITWGLTHTVGPAKAKEMLLLSDVLMAEQAHDIGLINGVFDTKSLADEVGRLAARIAAGPLLSYRWMKENVNMAVQAEYHEMLDRESITHLRCGQTADHQEGVQAFVEKRAPVFKGR